MSHYSKETMQQIWDLSILKVASKLNIKYSDKGAFRKCKCFMHDDHHPSMWFKVSNNTWSCPVCCKGGGLVSLVREHEKLTYDEALEWLIKTFNIYAYDDSDMYRPLKSKNHNINRNKLSSTMSQNNSQHTSSPSSSPSAPSSQLSSKSSLELELGLELMLPFSLIEKSLSTDTIFCRSLVSNGILSEEQMQHAAALYKLGQTNDGGVIFWNIDQHQQVHEGKIMWYTDDCHRDHSHAPCTISSILKSRGQLPSDWKAEKCFFGQHLLCDDNSIIAIVESEKTAVICSQLFPNHIWLSCGGLNQLMPDMFLPLHGHKIITFPDTDLKGEAHKQWVQRCREASRLISQPIYVSPLLERHATKEQKERKIDIADFIIESVQKD